jgi:beta-lactamase regulating signal transducer with metallopeptidase domain
MKNELLTAVQHLLGAGITGIYQGIVLVFLVWLSLRMARRTNASTHHAAWFCTLLMLVLLLVAHVFLDSRVSGTEGSNNTNPIPEAEGQRPTLPDPLLGPRMPIAGNYVPENRTPSGLPFSSSLSIPWSGEEGIALAVANLAADGPRLSPVPPESDSIAQSRTFDGKQFIERFTNPSAFELALSANIPRSATIALLAVWLAIAALRVFLLMIRLVQIRRLKREAAEPAAELAAMFRDLKERLGVNRMVALKVSTAYRSAMVLGFRHPVIILPAAEDLADAEPILRHELAHVCRYDDWLNLIQQLTHAVFFFHPGIWWVSKRLSLEREIACDDYVLQQCEHPRQYALLLANLAGRAQGSAPLLAPGASANKSQLQQRIDMILNTTRNRSPRLAKTRLGMIATTAALVMAAAIYCAPRIVMAHSKPISEPPTPPAVAVEDDSAEVDVSAPEPPTPLPPDVPSGPKLKLSTPVAVNIKPGATALPDAAPVPATIAVAPPVAAVAPVVIAVAPVAPTLPPARNFQPNPAIPSAAPYPPMAMNLATTPTIPPMALAQAPAAPIAKHDAHGRTKDMSIEERLARLEQMVESLTAQQKAKPGQFHMQPGMGEKDMATLQEFARDQAELARKQADLARQEADMAREHRAMAMTEQQIEEMKEKAQRQAEQAVEQARRANREKELMMRDEAKRQNQNKFKPTQDGSQGEIDALRKTRDELQREMQKLEQQIRQLERSNRLERDRKQVDERKDADEPAGDNQPSPKK